MTTSSALGISLLMAAALATSGCTGASRTSSPPPSSPQRSSSSSPAAADGTNVRLMANAGSNVRGDAFLNAATAQAANASLEWGKRITDGGGPSEMWQANLTFPRPQVNADCVRRATLHLRLSRVVGAAAQVSIYASAAVKEQRAAQLIDNQPSGFLDLSQARPGPRVVDVTTLIQTWLHGRFPSRGARVLPKAPLVLALRPATAEAGDFRVYAAAPGVSQGAPFLTIAECSTP